MCRFFFEISPVRFQKIWVEEIEMRIEESEKIELGKRKAVERLNQDL